MIFKQIISLLFLLNLVKFCEDSEAFYLDDNNNPQCIQCPDKCEYCSYNMDKQIYCYFCQDGYFRDDKKQCKPCSKHCQSCEGESLDKCTRLEEGYFYNNKNNKVSKCKIEGCGHCINNKTCTSCQKGYIEVKQQKEDQKEQNMQQQVTCKPCNIPQCTYCIKKNDQLQKEYLSCTLCESGYFIQNEKCEKCPENCEHCQSNNGECFNCKKGFKHNKMKNTCESNTIQNCHEMEDEENCSSCESHFYLTEDKKQCKNCSEKLEGCLYCSHSSEKDFKCHSCKDGFYYNKTQNKCLQCIENCLSCSEEKCYSCNHNFYYNINQNKCEQCKIEFCLSCGDNSKDCYDCGHQRFFNKKTKKCELCNDDCIGCYDSADNCQNCPINRYTFRQEIIVEQDSSQYQGFVGPAVFLQDNSRLQKQEFHIKHKMIKIKTKCFKKCPKKFEKHLVIQDESLKECFKVYKDQNKAKNFLKKIFSGNLNEKIQQIIDNYRKQIEQDYKDTKQKDDNSKYEECSFHGIQKYEIRGVYDNYKYCICDESYVGPICEIPRILYEQTQLDISKVLEQSSQHIRLSNKHKIQRHLHSLKKLVKVKLSLPLIEKIINIMYQLSHHELSIQNKIQSFKIYDYLLCRLIEIKELESHKNIKEKEFDSLVVREKFDWEKLIKQIMLLIEHTLIENNVSQSLKYVIKKEQNVLSQDSFNIYEYQLKNYFPEKGFGLDNPYLNDYYSKYIGSHVYLYAKNQTLLFFSSSYVIQMIYFDAQLFDSLIEDQNQVLLTNVLHMNLVDPVSSNQNIYPNDANIKKFSIQFSLLFLPLKENFINDVECTAFVYDKNLNSIKGTVKNLSTVEHETQGNEEDFLICEFDGYFPLDNHYFAILLNKN